MKKYLLSLVGMLGVLAACLFAPLATARPPHFQSTVHTRSEAKPAYASVEVASLAYASVEVASLAVAPAERICAAQRTAGYMSAIRALQKTSTSVVSQRAAQRPLERYDKLRNWL